MSADYNFSSTSNQELGWLNTNSLGGYESHEYKAKLHFDWTSFQCQNFRFVIILLLACFLFCFVVWVCIHCVCGWVIVSLCRLFGGCLYWPAEQLNTGVDAVSHSSFFCPFLHHLHHRLLHCVAVAERHVMTVIITIVIAIWVLTTSVTTATEFRLLTRRKRGKKLTPQSVSV